MKQVYHTACTDRMAGDDMEWMDDPDFFMLLRRENMDYLIQDFTFKSRF
jgi:hypothetical protein